MAEKQRKRGERSSFAVTCSLLSQYLKENRKFGDFGTEKKLPCSLEMEKHVFRSSTTMNLFPGSTISAENRNEPDLSEKTATMSVDPSLKAPNNIDHKENEINGQLTIFYDGKVVVFDNFPANKARELMEMASKSSLQHEPSAPVDLTMPIARRASLHRFLEKRKDRIISQAPYFLVHGSLELEVTPAKSEKNQTWLGLGHKPSFCLDFKI